MGTFASDCGDDILACAADVGAHTRYAHKPMIPLLIVPPKKVKWRLSLDQGDRCFPPPRRKPSSTLSKTHPCPSISLELSIGGLAGSAARYFSLTRVKAVVLFPNFVIKIIDDIKLRYADTKSLWYVHTYRKIICYSMTTVGKDVPDEDVLAHGTTLALGMAEHSGG